MRSFNPHTHAGCDSGHTITFDCGAVSIHTPTQGVTQGTVPFDREIKVSIHTPTQGVT